MELEEMTAFFTSRLDLYDEHMLREVPGCRAGYARMAALLPEGTARLLDLGCGTGLELEPIFARFPALKVTGVDLTAAMLDRLRAKFPDRELTLIRGSYVGMDFGRACYDAAVSFETLHHLEPEEKGALYRRVWEALTPEGVYVECDYIAATAEEEEALRAEHRRLRMEAGAGGDTLYHFDIPCTLEHQRALLEAAGFVQVTAEPLEGDTVLLTARKVTPTGA
ncbi:class I SAM-dependent methyltransferase [Intestinimonas timonensis]|uniref:class I SAM-dependent methyltransferase n=1 Tax=Intestinimonas timonensis TaxID=1689270 RepID=UPI003A8E8181